jgi:hypothetical protein
MSTGAPALGAQMLFSTYIAGPGGAVAVCIPTCIKKHQNTCLIFFFFNHTKNHSKK